MLASRVPAALLSLALVNLLVLGSASSPSWAGDRVAEADARISQTTHFLASDELEGRGLGSQGLERAADFIAQQFAAAHLKIDLYDGTPFQKFKFVVGSKLGEPNELAFVGPAAPQQPAEQKLVLKLDTDFTPLSMGGAGAFDLPLVFAGYGITAPEENYDDYAGLDVQGKAVILLRHEPQQNNPHGAFAGTQHSRHAPLSKKISNAYEHGAAGVIFVSSAAGVLRETTRELGRWTKAVDELAAATTEFKTNEHPTIAQIQAQIKQVDDQLAKIGERGAELKREIDPLLKFDSGAGEEAAREFPVVHCRREAIDQLLQQALKTDLATLEAEIDEKPAPHSQELTLWKATGKLTIARTETELKNVVGVLEGEGPLADETIVLGAHYDHLGQGGSGSLAPGSHEIHNGADDNSSGVAALIELAQQLAARPEKLRRRVVFIAFTAEERGLIGSARYTRDPLFPLEKTVAMLNMDMVGRLADDKLVVYGTGTADKLDQSLDQLNADYGFHVTKHPGGFGPSDQSSFYAKQIPVLHFFSGTHQDYHRPSDDADKLNIDGIRKVADMVAEMTILLANADDRPEYKATGSEARRGEGGDRPYFGSIPDFSQDQPGYGLTGVTKDGPAERAGLKGGDVIIQLGDSKVGNLEDFDSALRKHQPGDRVPVVVKRGDEEVTLEVTLDKPR